jgi:lysozyme
MTPEGKQKLKSLLVHHRAYKQFPHVDIKGNLVVGLGRNLTDRGISTVEAFYLLDDDIIYFTTKLNHILPFFASLSEARQIVLIDICFDIGINDLLQLKDVILALADKDYERAADHLLTSKWALQVSERASTLASIIRTDQL